MATARARTAVPVDSSDDATTISALRDISYIVGGVTVVEGVNLDLHDGEIVALLGPSGSGKSTLLRILAGLTKPTTGVALYRGSEFSGTNPGASIIFQSFALYPWLTVLENVELGMSARSKEERAATRERAIKAIDTIGLDGYENAYPRELSGGMRQRVGFARALAVEPEILCMDEPFSALDVLTAENLRSEVLRLWQSGDVPTTCILIITHGIEEALQLADRLVVLERDPGRIRTILPVNLQHPRDPKSKEFQELADLVYVTLTAEDDAPVVVESAAAATSAGGPSTESPAPGSASIASSSSASAGDAASGASAESEASSLRDYLDLSTPLITTTQQLDADSVSDSDRERYPMLPGVRIASVTGLLAFVPEEQVDLYSLGQRLQLDVDDLYPIIEAGEILGLLDVVDADVTIKERGRVFLDGSIDDRKSIVRKMVSESKGQDNSARLIREIYHLVSQVGAGGLVPQELIFDTILLKHFSPQESRRQLEIAIEWGRFAELYGYESRTGSFFLDTDDESSGYSDGVDA